MSFLYNMGTVAAGSVRVVDIADSLQEPCFARAMAEEFDALVVTTHPFHGTGPDMARFMGPEQGFHEHDARALGHWLRDRNAPQPDPRRVPGRPRANAAPGVDGARGAMTLHYSRGDGRRASHDEPAARDGVATLPHVRHGPLLALRLLSLVDQPLS